MERGTEFESGHGRPHSCPSLHVMEKGGKDNAGAEMMKRPLARSALSLGSDADLN